ncbi:response regulator [Paenibacillus sp. GCM10027626]|uniref:response regulator n=1 Tax=Paenibacillus sp. GCM10027626 TaxID=3273411 RepID=UPI00363D81ED
MYRILIVDDEPLIVNSMYRMLQEAAHLELETYRAYNVYEALECLKQTRIDVVISDIRMPGMSGIDLHRKIMESWPRCKVIFLTGYNDFDYARHAIRTGGVIDYVLKNEDDHIILTAVEKAFAQLDQADDRTDYMLNARKMLQMAIPALQKNTLFDLMRDSPTSRKELEKRFEASEIPLLADKCIYLVTGRVDSWTEDIGETDRMLLLYACQNIAEEYLAPTIANVSVVFESNKFVWFMQPKEFLTTGNDWNEAQEAQAWHHMKTRVYSILEAVQQTCRQLLKISISLVMGREPVEWKELGVQFHYLKSLLGPGANSGQELLILDSDQFGLNTEQGRRYYLSESQQGRKQLELLEHYLANGQRERFTTLFDEMMSQHDIPEYKFQLEMFYSLSLSLISYAIRVGLFDELFRRMDLGKTTQYDAHESWSDAAAYLFKVADELLRQYEPVPEEQNQRLITSIHEYVQSHLGGDLSLTKLATVVHHSPTYLSRLYKRMTGKMLSDYITEERMKKAQDQLAHSNMKIQEIAVQVGYEAAPQFNRSFKKMFKMTPQAYRDLFNTGAD